MDSDRDIAKKPITEKEKLPNYTCPTCYAVLRRMPTFPNYCSYCGQHIDWSEELDDLGGFKPELGDRYYVVGAPGRAVSIFSFIYNGTDADKGYIKQNNCFITELAAYRNVEKVRWRLRDEFAKWNNND